MMDGWMKGWLDGWMDGCSWSDDRAEWEEWVEIPVGGGRSLSLPFPDSSAQLQTSLETSCVMDGP